MPVIPPVPSVAWDDLAKQIGTGDLVLFSDNDGLGDLIQAVTGGPYSHTAMLIRPDATRPPLLWQEATQYPIADPETHVTPIDPISHTAHSGAQLGDARTVLRRMTGLGMTAYYRPMIWKRTPAFEQSVTDVMKKLDGIPFGSHETMVVDYLRGRLLGQDSGQARMFCAQLVAQTLKMAGLLDHEHPPNWYSPVSFSSASTDVRLLQGAVYAFERPIALPISNQRGDLEDGDGAGEALELGEAEIV